MAKSIDALPLPAAPKRDVAGYAQLFAVLRGDIGAWRSIARVVLCALQFGLMVQLLRAFQLESRAFRVVAGLACLAFPVHYLLPARWRMPFFALGSLAVIGVTFGPTNAAWIVVLGCALIGIGHLPFGFWTRVALQLGFAALLGAMRVQLLPSPVPQVIWPVLGSMFMFRILVYMYDLKTRSAPFDVWRALSYFFMLPNACFTLLPVIDYKTLQSTYYDDDEYAIYQKGVELMLRGVVHLLLYRLVYQDVLVDPLTVSDAGGAARFLFGTFFLYLRISGYFHLIAGMLHMFGFNLPETHHLYFLASSFTDFWRRINIFWKDFMQKVFFYPVHFPLARRLGTIQALSIATVYAFAWTWFLHAYQWFWIRGRFPVTGQDAIFWGSLGVLVLINMIWEIKFQRKRTLKKPKRTLKSELRLALETIGTFLVITLVWNVWSTDSFGNLWALMANFAHFRLEHALLIGGGLCVLGACAVWLGHRTRAQSNKLAGVASHPDRAFWTSAARVSALGCALLLCGSKPLALSFWPEAVTFFERLADASLNDRDAKLLQRGYYEELGDPTRFSAELSALYGERPPDWDKPTYMREVDGFPPYEPIPHARVTFKGELFEINRWGMRDKDYTKDKPPNTFRIVALGASHTEGQGVSIDKVYHSLIEERLNRELTPKTGLKYEILNYASGGYGPGSSLARLEQSGFAFQPDAVLFHVIDDYEWVLSETTRTVTDKGLRIPYDFVMRAVSEAGVSPGLNRSVATQRLARFAPELVRAYYQRLFDETIAHGATPIVVFIPIPEDQSDVQAGIAAQAETARSIGLPVIDITSVYNGLHHRSEIWARGYDHHPNARGQAMLAKALYEQLLPMLEHAQAR